MPDVNCCIGNIVPIVVSTCFTAQQTVEVGSDKRGGLLYEPYQNDMGCLHYFSGSLSLYEIISVCCSYAVHLTAVVMLDT